MHFTLYSSDCATNGLSDLFVVGIVITPTEESALVIIAISSTKPERGLRIFLESNTPSTKLLSNINNLGVSVEATLLHSLFDFPLLIQLPFLSGLYRYFCRFSRLSPAPFYSCGEVRQIMFHPIKRKFHLIGY